MSKRLPLLMTASVSTRGMKGAAFTDAEREAMYLGALRWYLKNLPEDQPIVFVENSGWDLGKLKCEAISRSASSEGRDALCRVPGRHGGRPSRGDEIASCDSRVEFISVDPAISDQSRGKGYNEILMINDAIKRSRFIREAGAFMKVTGRYPIYNLPRFLREAEAFLASGGQYYSDMKDHKVFDFLFPHNTAKWNGHAAYTVLFATTLDFYNAHLAGSYVDCNDYNGNLIETVWHKILIPYRWGRGEKLKHEVEQRKKVESGVRVGERIGQLLEEKNTPISNSNSELQQKDPTTVQLQLSTSTKIPHSSFLISHSSPVRLRLPVEPICGGMQGSAQQSIAASQSNESVKARLARFVGNCIRTFTPWFWF